MKARFQDRMVEQGRSYRTEEEKARRYEVFKVTAMGADKANASKREACVATPNGLADWTDEECECVDLHNFDWEIYIDHINNMGYGCSWLYIEASCILAGRCEAGICP